MFANMEDDKKSTAVTNTEELSEIRLAHVKEIFSLFDKDNDGAIMCRDVIAVLRSVGYNPAESDVRTLIDEYDAEGEGVIDFAVFLDLMSRVKREGETEPDMEEAFRVFDPNGSGYISAVDLRQVMTNLGEKLSEEEADDMVAYADRAGNGEINYRGKVGRDGPMGRDGPVKFWQQPELITVLLTDGDWR